MPRKELMNQEQTKTIADKAFVREMQAGHGLAKSRTAARAALVSAGVELAVQKLRTEVTKAPTGRDAKALASAAALLESLLGSAGEAT